jgi:hypothetical protein
MGFVYQNGGAQAGSIVPIAIGGGLIPYIAGITAGYYYWLGTSGNLTIVQPTTGYIQCLGFGLSSTDFYFIPSGVNHV